MRVIRRMTESVKCVRRLLSSGMEAMIHEAGIRVELLMELRPEGRGNEDEEPAYRTAVGSGVAAYSGAEEYGSGNLGLLRRLCGDAPCLPVGRIRFGGHDHGLGGGSGWTLPFRPAALPSAPVSYTHLRAHETKANLVCRLLL